MALRRWINNSYSQVSTSFECDGCSHHASFHAMENEAENAILRRLNAEKSQAAVSSSGSSRRKRLRIEETNSVERGS